MNSRELARQIQMLNALIGKTQAVSGGDIEAQSHWAKYICVLSAGFLENALAEVFTDFCRRAASQPVANFAAVTLGRIRNPKTQAFIELTQAFNKSWAASLEAFIENEGRKEAINSIMANRHLIAHGRDSGITMARVREYLSKSIDVVEFIEEQCR